MSFFDKVVSAFVVTEEEQQEAQKTQQGDSAQSPQSSARTVTTAGNAPDKAIVDKLCARLEEINFPKTDYLEFKQSMTDPEMVSSIPSEAMRMQIVFKVLTSSSPEFNKGVLISSLDKYVEQLNKWEQEAKAELQAKRAELNVKTDRIAELRTQIEKLNKECAQLVAEVESAESKLNAQDAGFTSAIDFVRNEFLADKQKINTNLK